MKKKIVAFFVCFAMVATLAGCASSSSASTTTATTEAPVVTVEKEEPAPEVSEPEKVEETEKTEKAEETEVEKPEPVEVEEAVEPELEAEEVANEEEQAEEVANEEESDADRLFKEYISDGDFKEAEQYGEDLGASEIYVNTKLIVYVFDNWFVQLSGGGQDTEQAYIAIGEWHEKNDCTYSWLFDFGEGNEVVDGVKYSSQGLFALPIVIDYMLKNPDPNTKPTGIVGDWKACDPAKPWISTE